MKRFFKKLYGEVVDWLGVGVILSGGLVTFILIILFVLSPLFLAIAAVKYLFF